MSDPADLVTLYFPAISEISETDVVSARSRLAAWLATGWPDLDTRANSVFGDLVLTPAAYQLAGLEVAVGRFMSDLNLGNVAAGTIWNCAFVTQFLKNFAVAVQETLQASGYIQLTFNADKEVTLDRGVKFKFGSDVFMLRLPHSGALVIKPVGTSPVADVNMVTLSEVEPGVFSAVLPVVGAMTSSILAGDSGTTTELPASLSAITALVDFNSGLPSESLATLAAKTRQTFYSASLTNRGSAAHYLQREFPDLSGVSPVLPGDAEMVRASANPLGISQGKVDIYVKSSTSDVALSQVVRLPYFVTQNSTSLKKFIGRLNLLLPPNYIDSITYGSGESAIRFLLDGVDNVLFSRSLDAQNVPLAAAAYSVLEELWLSLSMPLNINSEDLIIPSINDAGQYVDVVVSYRADPLLPGISQLLSSRDTRPANAHILPRGFVLMVLSNLTIQYTRKRGTTFNAEAARREIVTLFKNFGYPEAYSESKIHDAMYYAGASDVRAITCRAKVQWSTAQRFLPAGAPLPSANYPAAYAASLAARELTALSSKGLIPQYSDENQGTAAATYESIGVRNLAYLLDADNLVLSEVTI